MKLCRFIFVTWSEIVILTCLKSKT